MGREEPAPLPPGTQLAWRYQIRSLLGRGGMSAVYHARDHVGAADVALKVLDPEVAGGEAVRRFAREVRNASRLAHEGCVRLLDHGRSDDGSLYLAMELLSGPDLRVELARAGRLTVARAVAIGAALLDALEHAHEHGVLHRDVKPENVVFDGERVVLVDFGLSVLLDDAPLTAAGTCVGSPSYLAPERLLARDYDHRADLYAAGILLYELVAGRTPFARGAAIEVARRQVWDPPPPLLEICPEVPPALAEVVHRALAKEPGARFGTAREMKEALAGAVRRAGAPIGRRSRPAATSREHTAEQTTCAILLRDEAPLLRRLWGWLRYGRWRRPDLPGGCRA